jgi:hypothetical protein
VISPRELIHHACAGYLWEERLLRWSERLRGVDFTTKAEPDALGLDPAHARTSAPSRKKWLRKVLADLPIGPGDSIVDVGCGKGTAMRVMLEFPFAAVHGIELAGAIADTARRNFRTLKIPSERWRVFEADAASFDRLDSYRYVYLYNPFSCAVMERFMARVAASLQSSPRPLTLIYDNPICHDTIIAAGVLRKLAREYPDGWGNPIYLYANRSPA